eukprot:11124622-Alexandrium_andersonii.AAC.1
MAAAAVATAPAHRGAPLVPNQTPRPLSAHAGAQPCSRKTSASSLCVWPRSSRGRGTACAGYGRTEAQWEFHSCACCPAEALAPARVPLRWASL